MQTKKPAREQRSTVDAIQLLKQDHQAVRELLSKLEETTTRAAKRRAELLEAIALEVRVHAKIEEELFYPAFQAASKTKEDEKLFLEAAEEHDLVHIVLPAIEKTDPKTELFSAKAKVLKDLIEHHADEEEHEMFPRARDLMDKDGLLELGARLALRKQQLTD